MSQAGIVDVGDANPQIPLIFETNSGNAIAIANVIEILGTGTASTSASGNTISIQVGGSAGVIDQIDGDTGFVSATTVNFTGGSTGLIFQGVSPTMTLNGLVNLAHGGTSASLTASNGGVFYSTATAGAILSGTATANKVLMSGSSSAPSWSIPTFPNASASSGKFIISDGTNWIASTPTLPNSATSTGTILRADGTNFSLTTATYPNTTTVNQLLFSSANNVIGGITASNDGVLISSNAGIPSWLANSGTANFVLSANSGAPPSWKNVNSISNQLSIVKQSFITSGTYTPTPGLKYAIVEVMAGGGGGGSGNTSPANQCATGGGGSSGGYSIDVFSAATIGSSQVITIGSAGLGSTSDNANGGNGGTSSFGALLIATGGEGGNFGSAGEYSNGDTGSAGGGTFAGTQGTAGVGFLAKDIAGTGIIGLVYGGAGASSYFGGGVASNFIAGPGNFNNGQAASTYGAGGGGGVTWNHATASGGDGFIGLIIVTEYISS